MSRVLTPREELATLLPNLRAFAVSLCSDPVFADDLVQEALARALNKIDTFEPGTNLKAWVFTILRNAYFNHLRKRKLERSLEDSSDPAIQAVPASQDDIVELKELLSKLSQLSEDQREIILLVGAEGFSYEDAAEICDCPVGTVKSRVSRARARLIELIEGEPRSQLPRQASLKAAEHF